MRLIVNNISEDAYEHFCNGSEDSYDESEVAAAIRNGVVISENDTEQLEDSELLENISSFTETKAAMIVMNYTALRSRIEWLIEDYQQIIEDLEEDLKEQKVNMYLSGKLGVYAKVAKDLRDVLEEEDE